MASLRRQGLGRTRGAEAVPAGSPERVALAHSLPAQRRVPLLHLILRITTVLRGDQALTRGRKWSQSREQRQKMWRD